MDEGNPSSRSAAALRPAVVALALAWPVLAGAQAAPTPPLGLPDKGMLQLRFGSTSSQVVYVPPTGGATLPAQTLQTIRRNDCRLAQPSATRLLDFSATQGQVGVPVGLVAGSMGAYSGSQGTPCSRLASNVNQALTVAFGPAMTAAVPDTAFYRLELDIEAKNNLALELQILRDGVVTDSYFLRTGSSIVESEGSDLPGSPDRIFNCRAQSDSGPDSGSRDNCRWVVDQLGEGFRLVPRAGEGSLEGGSDPGVAGFSLVYLTQGETGALGCGPGSSVPLDENTNTIGDGINDAQCTVTRVDPSDFGGQCTQAIGYVFRNLDGFAEGCELIKSPGEQLAASITIKFPPEFWTPLGGEPKTLIEFSDGAGGLVPFTPERCIGTVVLDPNGTRTIAEVLTGELGAIDVVPGNDYVDWACILDNEQVYLGPTGDAGALEMQVTQTVLFWGDIRFSRE